MLRNAIFYARNLLLQSTQKCEGDEFIKRDFFEPTFKFNQRILNLVVRYAELSHPVDPNAQLYNDNNSFINTGGSIESPRGTFDVGVPKQSGITLRHAYNDVFSFRGWEIPNVYVMYQAYKMHKELKAKYP